MNLNNKKILLGITGSIAAYKACLVLRHFQVLGADVRVIMTDSAQKFLGKCTLEALTMHPVSVDLFPDDRTMMTEHVRLAEWADVILVCPATANCIGKFWPPGSRLFSRRLWIRICTKMRYLKRIVTD